MDGRKVTRERDLTWVSPKPAKVKIRLSNNDVCW